ERAGNGYEREQFEDAWNRYLPHTPPTNRYTGTTRTVEPKNEKTKPVQTRLVPVSEKPANPHEQTDVPVVPVSKHGVEQNGPKPLIVVGDPGYLELLAEAYRNGHVTEAEAKERHALHRALIAA